MRRVRLLRLGLMAVLVMAAANSWAQGANTGMGGRDEGVASILAKLKVMDQKNDAFTHSG